MVETAKQYKFSADTILYTMTVRNKCIDPPKNVLEGSGYRGNEKE
jgi:hypothetical protein